MALKENPALGKERISVLLFPTENLDRLQQMFTDLNRYAHKTSKSLDVLYDHRDHLSALTLEVAEKVPAFRGQIDKERISLPASSPKLLTLSALYDANLELLGVVTDQPKSAGFANKVNRATQYWMAVADAISDYLSLIVFHKNVSSLNTNIQTFLSAYPPRNEEAYIIC